MNKFRIGLQIRLYRRFATVTALLLVLALTSGCSLLFGGRNAEPTATPEEVNSVPTFTPTPLDPPSPTSVALATVAPTPMVLQRAPTLAPDTQTVSETTDVSSTVDASTTPLPIEGLIPTTTPIVAAEAPAEVPILEPTTVSAGAPASDEATLTIEAAAVNLREGPGTEFALAGAASAGESFAVVAKSPAGDWWQICCINEAPAWVFGDLVVVQNGESVAVATDLPTPPPTPEIVAVAPTPEAVAPEAVVPDAAPEATAPPPAEAPATAPDPSSSSAGFFDPNATYQIVHFKVLGLEENNGGIRDSRAQHLIFLTVLDQNGNGVDGAVVKNLVGEGGEFVTGSKGPGKAEITMAYEPFKLQVVADPSGAVSSQVSNQMGLAFPHLPDLVGRMGDENYEYGVCPTLEIKCQWPIQLVHFSYEITFQKVK